MLHHSDVREESSREVQQGSDETMAHGDFAKQALTAPRTVWTSSLASLRNMSISLAGKRSAARYRISQNSVPALTQLGKIRSVHGSRDGYSKGMQATG